jgi:hypothetical protein
MAAARAGDLEFVQWLVVQHKADLAAEDEVSIRTAAVTSAPWRRVSWMARSDATL